MLINLFNYVRKKNIKYIVLQKNAYLLKQPSIDTVELSIQYEMLQNLVKNYKINNLILPEGNSPIYEVFNLVAIKLKIKTICIQHGWSTIIHNGFRNMHYSIFLSWGKIYSDILQKYNPKQNFKSVGNHVLNVECSNKKKDSVSFFLQTITPLITKEIFDSLIDFIVYISDNYPTQQLIIREHPGAPLTKEVKDKLNRLNNIKFMNSDKYLLSEVLNISKVAVSIYSSTLYESLLYDTIPFIYNLTSLNHLTPNLSKLKVGIEVNTYTEAIKEMNNLLAKNKYKDIYNNILIEKMSYFETTGKYAVDNIIKEINAI